MDPRARQKVQGSELRAFETNTFQILAALHFTGQNALGVETSTPRQLDTSTPQHGWAAHTSLCIEHVLASDMKFLSIRGYLHLSYHKFYKMVR